jgi:LuxR family maltose regulon positive regulatory protein
MRGLEVDIPFAKLDEYDLEFTFSEMLEYFVLLGIKVDIELAHEIFRLTGGWPLGVFFSTIALRRPDIHPPIVRQALKTSIGGLLDGEVLSLLPEEFVHLLIKLSLIDFLDVDLVREIAGDEMMLLINKHDQIIHFDQHQNAYYLHEMMGRHLRTRQNELSDAEKKDVYGLATAWCRDNGMNIDALRYYAKMGDYATVAKATFADSRVLSLDTAQLVVRIFMSAPPEVFDEVPSANIAYPWALVSSGNLDAAGDFLRGLIDRYLPLPESPLRAHLLSSAHNILGYIAWVHSLVTGDYSFSEHFEKAVAYWDSSTEKAAKPAMRAVVPGYVVRVGEPKPEMIDAYIGALDRSEGLMMYMLGGCWAGLTELNRAEIALYRCDYKQAEKHAIAARDKAQANHQMQIVYHAAFFLVRAYLGMGDYEAMRRTHEYFLSELDTDRGDMAAHAYDVVNGWVCSCVGDFNAIATWILSEYTANEMIAFASGVDDLLRVRIYLEMENYNACLAYLAGRNVPFGAARFLLGKVGINSYAAACHYHLGNLDAMREHFEEAYRLAAPAGIILPFVELGNHARSLTAALLKDPACTVPDEWLAHIRAKANTYAKRVSKVRTQYRQLRGMSDTTQFTTRELQLLTDVSQGLTRTEIAIANNLSINTVKVILQNVYNKLGVASSIEAVHRAIADGLIG